MTVCLKKPCLPLLLFLLLASPVVMSAQDDFKEIQSKVTEFTLANGMKFIVLERHQAPVASFYTYADVGSVQEVTGITGLAHIFEHIAFKGTPTIGTEDYQKEKPALEKVAQAFLALQKERFLGAKADPAKIKQLEEAFKKAQDNADKLVKANEFGEIIEKAGGRGLNASTAWDRTDYFFSLPSNETELWFYLESERFFHPVFRQFYKERDVVMNERRMRTENNPIGKLLEEFLAVAYKAHPYGEPVVGHMSDLENITVEDAAAFFKKYYCPSNLISAVVGDVDPAKVRVLAEKYFGRIPSGPKPSPLRTMEPPQIGERRVSLKLQSQRVVLMGYHKPDINHPDDAAYDALASLLSDGRSSRLYRSLVKEKKMAVSAGGFGGLPGQKYPGLFLFYAMPSQGHTNEEVLKALDEEIERLKAQPVDKEELQGVKQRAKSSLLSQLDDNTQLAGNLTSIQALTGDWRNLFKQLDKINRITEEDIQRVAKATFYNDNRTIGTIDPIENKPSN
jgi:predicted Zn-dependent peptidase